MSVQILCPNGRRVTVKLSPNTPLLYALEQACLKQGYDSSKHILKQGRNKIDVSSPFQFSGLTNNAKLELVETDDDTKNKSQDVELMLQTIDGQRLKGIFPTNTSLWDILKYHNLEGPNISVVYMRLQINRGRDLKEKTLKDLGIIGGRAIIRIVPLTPCNETLLETSPFENQTEKREHKDDKESEKNDDPPIRSSNDDTTNQTDNKVDQPTVKDSSTDRDIQDQTTYDSIKEGNKTDEFTSNEEYSCENLTFPVIPISIFPDNFPINRDITHYDKPLEGPTQYTTTTTTGEEEEEEPMEIDFQKMLEEARMEAKLKPDDYQRIESTEISNVRRTYQEPCFRNPIIYHLDSITATPTTELPDKFFQVTVSDVIMMQQDLKRQVQSLANAPLETQVMREQFLTSSSPGYIQTVIRVHLPDQWVIQGCFNSGESIKSLVSFVREHLSDPKIKFHLYTTPPKQILKSGRPSFKEAGFVPAANIHLGFDEETPLINSDGKESSILSEESMRLYCHTALEAEIAAHKNRVDSSSGHVHNAGRGHRESAANSSSSSSSSSRQNKEDSTTGTSSSAGQKDGSGQKLPKWLKLGHNK